MEVPLWAGSSLQVLAWFTFWEGRLKKQGERLLKKKGKACERWAVEVSRELDLGWLRP